MVEKLKNQSIPLIIGVSIFCLFLVLSVFAWTGPSGTPPDSNAPAPINVGSSGQEKEGKLGIAIPGGESLDGSYGLTVGTASNPLGIKTAGDVWIDGNFYVDTNAGGKAAYITRLGATTQGLKVYATDRDLYTRYIEDSGETSPGTWHFINEKAGGSSYEFMTAQADGDVIFNSGNVGIGTTNPGSYKLYVNGNTILNGNFYRTAHSNGYLVGSYNNVGANSLNTNPIYTIGSNYMPTDTTLGNMYGTGYTHTNASFITDPGPNSWGMYVAADGDARVFLAASSGGSSYLNAGNVGIGTTAPAAKLDVAGSIRGDSSLSLEEGADPNWYPRITFSNAVAGKSWVLSMHTNGDFYLNTNDYVTSAQNTFYVWEHFSVTGSKNFEIPHPLDPNKNLVHSSLEGPEIALFYRGTSQLKNGKADIELPDYFEAMARKEDRSILLTNIDGFDKLSIQTFKDGSQIKDGQFTVIAEKENSTQKFNWEVKAVRADISPLQVEIPNSIHEMK